MKPAIWALPWETTLWKMADGDPLYQVCERIYATIYFSEDDIMWTTYKEKVWIVFQLSCSWPMTIMIIKMMIAIMSNSKSNYYNICLRRYWWLGYWVCKNFLQTWHENVKIIVHFTVVCLVTWPMNESEAGVDLVLIETSLLFLCKFLPISMTTTSWTYEKEGSLYHNKVNTSLTFI